MRTEAVNPQALVGETIVDTVYGDESRKDARPYTRYTLVMKSGRRFVISQCMGEVLFSEIKE